MRYLISLIKEQQLSFCLLGVQHIDMRYLISLVKGQQQAPAAKYLPSSSTTY